jgi:hypothetical protein
VRDRRRTEQSDGDLPDRPDLLELFSRVRLPLFLIVDSSQ